MRNLSLKRLPARTCMLALLALALASAFLLACPVRAHAVGDPPALTVTRADDADEAGTLRWALGQANAGAGDRIEFDVAAMGSSVIQLESELPAVVSTVSIAGPDGGVTIRKAPGIDLPAGWRHLRIDGARAAFDVSVSGVTFEGPGAQGASVGVENGGVFVGETFSGTLALAGCTLKDNLNDLGNVDPASMMARGGAVNVLSEGAALRMTDCVVKDNAASSFGGGVYSFSPVVAEDCAFSGNSSLGDSAGGGALLSVDQAELTRCRVEGNHSDGDSGGVQSGALTLTGCVVSGNAAGAEGSLAAGGGVGAVELSMAGCEVRDNTCTGAGAGIYVSTGAEITESIVSGNDSAGVGGGAFIARDGVVRSSEIAGNTSGNAGAGVAVGDETGEEASTLELIDVVVRGNSSLDAGGGIFVYEGCALALTDATVSENEAELSGGGVYGEGAASLGATGGRIVGNASGASGGGVFLENGEAAMERCVVAENAAAESGGGLLVRGLTGRDVQLSRNVAGEAGGGVLATFYVEANGSTFDGNTAQAGGAMMASDVALSNCTVSGNTAREEGGGVAGLAASLVNCTVSGNVSGAVGAPGATGGGVLADELVMRGCIVAGNHDAAGNRSELAVEGAVDNGTGAVADSHGARNIVGVPAGGLGVILETQVVNGREAGALKDNGGLTPTIMIVPDGPAQDVAAPGDYAVPNVDQRGGARPFGAAADLGAVEVSGLSLEYGVEPFGVYRGGDEPLTGKVEAPLRSVLGVELDGAPLEPGKHYALSEGSTVVTLAPACLKELKSGAHEVTVSFTNGGATLPLKVELAGPPVPKPAKPLAPTGDGAGPLVAMLAAAAATAAAVLGSARRRLG